LLQRRAVLLSVPCSSGGRCCSTLPAPAEGGAAQRYLLQRQRVLRPSPCELPRPPSSKNLAKFRGPGGPNKSLPTHLRHRLGVPPWPRCFTRCGWCRSLSLTFSGGSHFGF